MLMANQELDNDGKSFIHGICAWPEAMCIVGLPYQFHDITRFFCGPLEFYPLYIDDNIQLGAVLCDTNHVQESTTRKCA